MVPINEFRSLFLWSSALGCSGMAEASRILVHAIELWAQDSVFFRSDPLLDFFPYWLSR